MRHIEPAEKLDPLCCDSSCDGCRAFDRTYSERRSSALQQISSGNVVGTGNSSPWNRKVHSPGGGDNLILCSIVALNADTGEYVWHYQTTPGETWSYNSSMDITLATLDIAGKPRPVVLHAPKNGFFYVIDRNIGRVLSAEKFCKVTWAERIDLTTRRYVEGRERVMDS